MVNKADQYIPRAFAEVSTEGSSDGCPPTVVAVIFAQVMDVTDFSVRICYISAPFN